MCRFFNQICENKSEICRKSKFWILWKKFTIIQNYSLHSLGDTPDINPKLLASAPADSIEEDSVADWMVATSMIAELKDQDFFREQLGHADFLGQDAKGPDGEKTVDYERGLTTAWDVARMMRELLGCSTQREILCFF